MIETTHRYIALNNTVLLQENVPLADKSWFKTGGNARYYAEPTTIEEFQEAIMWAHHHALPIFILGEGANILIADTGFHGLVIKPIITTIYATAFNATHSLVTAGAGCSFPSLINYCLENNYTGLEEFSGIPGTVGGSVYINIHYFEFLLAQFLHSATVINRNTGAILIVDNAWFNFGYNASKLQEKEYFIIDATFIVKNASIIETAYACGRKDEMIRHRTSRYPTSRTCGSFFRNFLNHEVTLISNGKKMMYVAYYLDKIGVKGQLSIGGASVSYQHANMLVSSATATSSDIVLLARAMQEKVLQQFGIIPQPECILVGFDVYPLL
ncbi:MAG: UDP-N-acetylmuramate dehydrogenase [Candidatus Babeliaceae bacterium]|jgi:UDP-N-acetylmuramate dehydrogenase